MAILELRGVTKTYGSGENAVHAVKDVSFELAAGEFVALIGPSGSGKTTLLAMIGALLTPTAGEIVSNGRRITDFSNGERARFRRDRIGYVFQSNNLVPYLTAKENLMVARAIGGKGPGTPAQRADELLQELGLGERGAAIVTDLSGGERQRVAIGRALMNDPELILVDEPTASLDSVRGKQVVLSLIDEVKHRGKAGIMVTHDLAMAELADRVLEMHDGELRHTRETS
ncbi:MAG: ABC transporter ATP-binding protein [Dehalococcoidia bacterium]